MINHMRTLLLNRLATAFTAVPSSEYIDPAFHPIQLPNELAAIKRVLIPGGVDLTSECYIAATIMQFLHGAELAPYTVLPDSRITYSATTDASELCRSPVSYGIAGAGSDVVFKYRLNQAGIPTRLASCGQYEWVLTPASQTDLRVVPSRGIAYTVSVVDTLHPGRSNTVELISDYLSVYFELPSNYLTDSFTVRVALTVPVVYDIAAVALDLDKLLAQSVIYNRLFVATGDYAATISELKSNWSNATEITVRFGTIVLAYLFQCDAMWREGV